MISELDEVKKGRKEIIGKVGRMMHGDRAEVGSETTAWTAKARCEKGITIEKH